MTYRQPSPSSGADAIVGDPQPELTRISALAFIRSSRLIDIVTAPVAYLPLAPLVLLDIALLVYQVVCFRIWGIPRVRRAAYVVIDRHRLAYLNGIQKVNCVYCGYANGVIALAREVASLTEAHWCPIKHHLPISGPHQRYPTFAEYGDASEFSARTAESDSKRAQGPSG